MKRINGRAIIIDNDEVLLMFRRKVKEGKIFEYYAIPGGGQEKNETIEECIVREIKEEFSLDVEVKEYLGTVEDNKNIGYIYKANIIGGTLSLGGEEKEHNSISNYYEPKRVKLKDIDSLNILEENKKLIKKAIEL